MSPTSSPSTQEPSRFRRLSPIGRGATGEVWQAEDRETGQTVALKLLGAQMGDPRRVEREIAALRHLNIPGVVRFVEAASDAKGAWIAMELVAGEPFPGRPFPTTWTELAPLATALLTSIGAVHAHGIVHRDLKPSNILVRPSGQPVILDFGLARGGLAGDTFTRDGAMLGTPRYAAPEQCRGARVDNRGDLYAIAVMLVEALSGEVPHANPDLYTLLADRASRPAPTLHGRGLPAPLHVLQALELTLHTNPDRRPPTAEALLRLLDRPQLGAGRLPFLGGDRGRRLGLERVRAGRGLRVSGPPGAGLSRWLDEVREALEAEGWQGVRVATGLERPYAALLGALGLDPAGGAVEARLGAALDALADQRRFLLIDGWDALDRYSRRLLEARHSQIPALITRRAEGELHLGPLDEADLVPLFAGVDRIFHTPTDAAALLHRRTGGQPGALGRELELWGALGLCTFVEGPAPIRISRPDLERVASLPQMGGEGRAGDPQLDELLHWLACGGARLPAADLARARGEAEWELTLQLETLAEQGLVQAGATGWSVQAPPAETLEIGRIGEIHEALAGVLPVGDPDRVQHLRRAGRVEEAAAEALAAATSLLEEGRPAAALGLLESTLGAPEAARWTAAPGALVALLGRCAWVDASPDVHRRAQALAHRLHTPPDFRRLLQAHAPGGSRLDLAELDAMGPQEGLIPELLRLDLRLRAAASQGLGAWRAALAHAQAAVGDHPIARCRSHMWASNLAYAQGDLAIAAAEAAAAARACPAQMEALDPLFRAATVELERASVAQARALAEELRAAGLRLRLPQHEARGELVLRLLAERTDPAAQPDRALIAAAGALGATPLAGLLLLVEGRIAWRRGQHAPARTLADQAEAVFAAVGAMGSVLCAQALGLACGAPVDVAGLLRAMGEVGRPDIAVEVLAFVASAGPLPPGDWIAALEQAAAALPAARPDWPIGAFSLDEARKRVRAASGLPSP